MWIWCINMKRLSIIPSLILSITLTGCSFVNNLFNSNKPSLENKGQEVDKETFIELWNKRLSETNYGPDTYDSHTGSFVFAEKSIYSSEGKLQYPDKKASATSHKGNYEGSQKYDSNHLMFEKAKKSKYVTITKGGEEEREEQNDEENKRVYVSKDSDNYTYNPKNKTYSVSSGMTYVYALANDTINNLKSFPNYYGESLNPVLKYYVNKGKVFTIEETYEDVRDYSYNGKKSFSNNNHFKSTLQYHLNKNDYSFKRIVIQNDSTTYYDYSGFPDGTFSTYKVTYYVTSTFELKSVNLSKYDFSGYTKVNSLDDIYDL